MQPDKVDTMLAKTELTDGGMVSRLLVCHTRAQPRAIVDGTEGIPNAKATDWEALTGKLVCTFRFAKLENEKRGDPSRFGESRLY